MQLKRLSIAGKFSFFVFALVISLGILFAVSEAYLSYRKEIKDLRTAIEQIKASHVPFLINSLWLTNYDLLQQQLEAIGRFQYIDCVEVRNDEGRVFRAGASDTDQLECRSEPLEYSYKDTQVAIGTLSIYIDYRQIQRTVLNEQISTLGFHLILALLIVIFVSFLFQRLVGRHLAYLSDLMKKDSPDKFDQLFELPRKKIFHDELDYLTDSINSLRNKLKSYIDQQTLLLQEVHHRIKNNMQTMTGLLYLQEMQTENSEAAAVLKEAQSRLQSMTLLYEKLYRSEAVRDMPAQDYLPELLGEMQELTQSGVQIEQEADIEDIVLPVRVLFPLGIMLNELVSNSMKHAFIGRESGQIYISLKSAGDREIEFIYRDDGVGLPQQVVQGDSSGLGIVLIKNLAQQMGGAIDLLSASGFQARLLIKLDEVGE